MLLCLPRCVNSGVYASFLPPWVEITVGIPPSCSLGGNNSGVCLPESLGWRVNVSNVGMLREGDGLRVNVDNARSGPREVRRGLMLLMPVSERETE